MKLRPALLLLLAFCFVALPAFAQNDIYDNGPTSGTVSSWSINFGFVTSDTFTIGTAK